MLTRESMNVNGFDFNNALIALRVRVEVYATQSTDVTHAYFTLLRSIGPSPSASPGHVARPVSADSVFADRSKGSRPSSTMKLIAIAPSTCHAP